MFRPSQHPRRHARQFKRGVSKTKAINMAPAPQRGGLRL